MIPSNHLILCQLLLLLPSIFPSIKVFSNESLFKSGGQSIGASASVLLMNIQDWLPLGLTGLTSLQPRGLSRVFSSTTVQKHQFFGTQLYFWSDFHICTLLLAYQLLYVTLGRWPILSKLFSSIAKWGYKRPIFSRLGEDQMKEIKVLVLSCVQLFSTPWTITRQAPLSMEFSRLEYWSGLPVPFPGDFPNSGIEPRSLYHLSHQGRSNEII